MKLYKNGKKYMKINKNVDKYKIKQINYYLKYILFNGMQIFMIQFICINQMKILKYILKLFFILNKFQC